MMKDKTALKKWKHEWYEKHKEEVLSRNKERRESNKIWMDEYIKTVKCDICGKTGKEHPDIFSFHHVNPDIKTESISYMVKYGFAKETILEELKKCVAICENCHRKHHNKFDAKRKTNSNLRKERIRLVRDIKTEKGCCVCGEKDWRCLMFKHIDSSKEKTFVSDMTNYAYNLEEIEKEINTCVCICANCSREQKSYAVIS